MSEITKQDLQEKVQEIVDDPSIGPSLTKFAQLVHEAVSELRDYIEMLLSGDSKKTSKKEGKEDA